MLSYTIAIGDAGGMQASLGTVIMNSIAPPALLRWRDKDSCAQELK